MWRCSRSVSLVSGILFFSHAPNIRLENLHGKRKFNLCHTVRFFKEELFVNIDTFLLVVNVRIIYTQAWNKLGSGCQLRPTVFIFLMCHPSVGAICALLLTKEWVKLQGVPNGRWLSRRVEWFLIKWDFRWTKGGGPGHPRLSVWTFSHALLD